MVNKREPQISLLK
ncbi:uncharacterized protein FFNC_07041 [Fusarium fujikuroi]|nr:uncharacterized protein FFE2_16044 [Fusarium fujikuroi]SCO39707.1 uncharacterized protein FFNC_07041 [Fusarium fujikuroi]SCV58425.1 uncharacterized protein FFFS_13187 [Fusarium fujikuroi]